MSKKKSRAHASSIWQELLGQWADRLPLLLDLATTPQDPGWHGEGDVETHTLMVLDEISSLLDGPAAHLEGPRREALVLAAAFHDIAKPLVTREREVEGVRRVVAPRHAQRGRSYLALRLLGAGLAPAVLRHVLALVGHHHDPIRLVRNEAPARHYFQLARQVDLELVYWLEVADMRGRICADLQQQLDHLDLFRLWAQEHGVWNVEDPYAGWRQVLASEMAGESAAWQRFVEGRSIYDFEAGLIHTPQEAISRAYPARRGYPQLVVLCGPSGSGKSTWIREHLPRHHVVSMDRLRAQITGRVSNQAANGRVRQRAREQLREHLRAGQAVVWDATNLRRDFRAPLVQIGIRYGALVTLVALQVPEDEIVRRNGQRESAVPTDRLLRQLDELEWPDLDEAHEVDFVLC